MDKPLSKKNEKALLTALARAKEAGRQMEIKEEEKRWAPISVPATLEDCLTGLTKSDLSDIRTNLGVYGASSLKKQELITVLEQQFPIMLPHLLNKIDDTRYKIIKQIASGGGHAFLPLETNQLNYFKARGMIFSGTHNGKKTLVMPQEVLQCFSKMDTNSFRETVRRNTEWVKLSQGILFYYGFMDFEPLCSMVTSHAGTNEMQSDYLPVLEEASRFYKDLQFRTEGVSNSRARNVEELKNEHQARPDLSFYPFTKAQLIAAGEPDFVDRTRIYQAFVSFIMDYYPIDRDKADSLVKDCVYAVQNGEVPGNLLQMFQYQLVIDNLELIKGFMDHIVKLSNSTKQWFLKGYSPDELSSSRNTPIIVQPAPHKAEVIDIVTRNKVGRNDPCPCGSGKKFKKCCGQ
ncbi:MULTISPECIES: SEC-C metal-binding domain-containing protein [unclassified Paenibacillus]|uniref:SEC-C metal-binding domain-containing protein n=1 Tax=unclassified Paenibacillus TaxID=185978 RepID=UPI0036311F59